MTTNPDLRSNFDFQAFTNEGHCWRCGGIVVAYFSYVGPGDRAKTCYVLSADNMTLRDCAARPMTGVINAMNFWLAASNAR